MLLFCSPSYLWICLHSVKITNKKNGCMHKSTVLSAWVRSILLAQMKSQSTADLPIPIRVPRGTATPISNRYIYYMARSSAVYFGWCHIMTQWGCHPSVQARAQRQTRVVTTATTSCTSECQGNTEPLQEQPTAANSANHL